MLQYWLVGQCWHGSCCIPLQCLALKGGSSAQTSRVSVLGRHTTLCHQAFAVLIMINYESPGTHTT